MTVNLSNANVIVSTIDVEDAWFYGDTTDKVKLPGQKGSPADSNKVSRKQARSILMGIVSEGLGNLPLGQALDTYRGPGHGNLKGDQHDLQLVAHSIGRMRQQNTNLDLTEGQRQMVATNLAALAGSKAHFDPQVQGEINKLSERRREQFLDQFMAVSTQGQLDNVIQKYRAFVGDPSYNRAMAAKSMADEVAGIDIDADEEDDTEVL